MNEGKYLARGRTLALGEAKTGTPQIAVGFELLAGGTITWHGYLTPAAEEHTVESIQAMGWEGNDLTELPAIMDAGKISKVVELVVINEEYNGKARAKVKYVNAVGGKMAPLKGDALSEVAARIKQRIGHVAAPAANADQSSQSDYNGPDVPPPGEDDIPF